MLGSNSVNLILFAIQISCKAILEYAAPVWCPFIVKDIVLLKKSPEESVETGSRPKEGQKGLRRTLFHFKLVTIKESKTGFFSDRVF